MNEQKFETLVAGTRMQERMRETMRLHFVGGLSVAEAARRVGVQRQDAHGAAKRIRELHAAQPARPQPTAPDLHSVNAAPQDPVAAAEAALKAAKQAARPVKPESARARKARLEEEQRLHRQACKDAMGEHGHIKVPQYSEEPGVLLPRMPPPWPRPEDMDEMTVCRALNYTDLDLFALTPGTPEFTALAAYRHTLAQRWVALEAAKAASEPQLPADVLAELDAMHTQSMVLMGEIHKAKPGSPEHTMLVQQYSTLADRKAALEAAHRAPPVHGAKQWQEARDRQIADTMSFLTSRSVPDCPEYDTLRKELHWAFATLRVTPPNTPVYSTHHDTCNALIEQLKVLLNSTSPTTPTRPQPAATPAPDETAWWAD